MLPRTDKLLGYGPVSFFVPHLGYGTCNDPLVCLDEFRTMVKELHRAGIEVILDVVYNHTGEGTSKDRHFASVDWKTAFITFLGRIRQHMRTIPALVTLSRRTTPS